MPVDSSHASRPLPGATIAFAVVISSSRYFESDMRVVWRREARIEGARKASVTDTSARTKARAAHRDWVKAIRNSRKVCQTRRAPQQNQEHH